MPREVISPGHDGQAGRHHRLAGHAAEGILGQVGIEHAVGDLIGEFVRMPHADGFTGEKKFACCHGIASCLKNGRKCSGGNESAAKVKMDYPKRAGKRQPVSREMSAGFSLSCSVADGDRLKPVLLFAGFGPM